MKVLLLLLCTLSIALAAAHTLNGSSFDLAANSVSLTREIDNTSFTNASLTQLTNKTLIVMVIDPYTVFDSNREVNIFVNNETYSGNSVTRYIIDKNQTFVFKTGPVERSVSYS